MPEAARTIVKSPPELWAEVSDPAALARHLGAFGEIRITRLEPEATVAWEGDRASGTVELEPAGWGTRVKVVAEQDEEPPVALAEELSAVVGEPPPEPQTVELPAIEDESQAPRRGLWSRMFRRRAKELGDEPAAVEGTEPEPAPEAQAAPDRVPEHEPAQPEAAGVLDTAAVLDEMLDSLGAAHHRPFSRG